MFAARRPEDRPPIEGDINDKLILKDLELWLICRLFPFFAGKNVQRDHNTVQLSDPAVHLRTRVFLAELLQGGNGERLQMRVAVSKGENGRKDKALPPLFSISIANHGFMTLVIAACTISWPERISPIR